MSEKLGRRILFSESRIAETLSADKARKEAHRVLCKQCRDLVMWIKAVCEDGIMSYNEAEECILDNLEEWEDFVLPMSTDMFDRWVSDCRKADGERW